MKMKTALRITILLLIICLLPVVTYANKNEITVDSELQLSFESDRDSYYRFTFKAPESATYVLCAEGTGGEKIHFMVDQISGSQSGSYQFLAKKGKEHSIEIWGRSASDTANTVTVTLVNSVPASSASFDKSVYVVFLKPGQNYVDVEGNLSPFNASVTGNWIVSNTNVVQIDYVYDTELHARVKVLREGESNISFTSSNGIEAVAKILVKEPESLQKEEFKSFSIEPQQSEGYAFTAPQDGLYYVNRNINARDEIDSGLWMTITGNIHNAEGVFFSAIRTNEEDAYIGLKKNETCIIEIQNDYGVAIDGSVEIYRADSATSMSITGAKRVGLGHDYFYGVEFVPYTAAPMSIEWKSENPKVLRIEENNGSACKVSALTDGTATLIATSESGLAASKTIQVNKHSFDLKGETLVLESPNKINLSSKYETTAFEFVPTKSGYYHLDHDANNEVVIGVIANNQELLAASKLSKNNDGMLCNLDAGVTYHIYTYHLGNEAISYNLRATHFSGNNCWINVHGNWFYLKQNNPVSGWQEIDAKWYYFHESTCVMQNGWQKINDKWYYLDSYMLAGWQTIDGKKYYLGTDGVMKTGLLRLDGKQYCLDDHGELKSGWVQVGGKWYYLDSEGVVQTGWLEIGGKTYFLNPEMKTGWIQSEDKWYYLDSEMKNGWVEVNGKWYFLYSDMKTGWRKINGMWYYLDPEMKTHWVNIGNRWYYLGNDGTMKTGWQQVGKNWYYLQSNGVMLTGTHTIRDKIYTFDSNGALITK